MIARAPKTQRGSQWDYIQDPSTGEIALVRNGSSSFNAIEGRQLELRKRQVILWLSEGLNFTKICKKPGMPSRMSIWNWMDADPEFKALVEKARKVKADVHADKFEEVAEKVTNKNDRPSRVKADIHKHLMAMGDRERFAPTPKMVAQVDASVSIVFNTGIERPDPIAVEAIRQEPSLALGQKEQDGREKN